MAQYKGVEVADDLLALVRHMDGVDETREALQRLQGVWDNLSMLGQLSGTGVELGGVREAFSALTSRLLNQLAGEARRKAGLQVQAQAQVAINIMVRNLFERTADIGFLATDGDLRQFAERSDDERARSRPALLQRLREYQRKYSVYEDVVLLGTEGRVLARLHEATAVTTTDGVVGEALSTGQPYVERFTAFDLMPESERTLVYAHRVMSSDERRAVAVLCLCFRFADECARIFSDLQSGGWGVVVLLDDGGRVLGSSDALQVPVGAVLPLSSGAEARLIRFAGRQWLAATCAAQAYQGYAGPGWFGHAMVPLEHAFQPDASSSAAAPFASSMLQALTSSPLLFSEGLRDIPRSAQSIEAELRRAVWNGNVALSAVAADRDSAFSKTLLREIGATGARTRDVFTRAIAELNHTVISALLDDSRSRAALAIDIMDRNLYERANDCRWWALTPAFRRLLDGPTVDAAAGAELSAILQTIHGLYTVYANLLLFDRNGCIVAVSRADESAAPGRRLDAEWVQRTLALADAQAYAVSDFEPSDLYGGRHACIYTAAVRGLSDMRRAVGGIAIVFDAEPQFQAMLVDTLPRDEHGAVSPGALNLFVDRGGRVLAHSLAMPDEAAASERPNAHGVAPVDERLEALAIGSPLALGDVLATAAGERSARILPWRGRLYAVGACLSTGYREYKSTTDAYRHEVLALTFVPLADGVDLPSSTAKKPLARPAEKARRPAAAGPAGRRLDLATFQVAGQWYAVPGSEVVEAASAQRILPLPARAAHALGSVMHRGQPVLVLHLARLLGFASQAGAADPEAHLVIVRAAAGRPCFGLLVDALGDNPEVDISSLQALGSAGSLGDSLVECVVNAGTVHPADDMLKVLSLPRLTTAALGPAISVSETSRTKVTAG